MRSSLLSGVASGDEGHAEPLIGKQRGEVVEKGAFFEDFEVAAIDRFDLEKGEKSFLFLRRPYITRYGVSFA